MNYGNENKVTEDNLFLRVIDCLDYLANET